MWTKITATFCPQSNFLPAFAINFCYFLPWQPSDTVWCQRQNSQLDGLLLWSSLAIFQLLFLEFKDSDQGFNKATTTSQCCKVESHLYLPLPVSPHRAVFTAVWNLACIPAPRNKWKTMFLSEFLRAGIKCHPNDSGAKNVQKNAEDWSCPWWRNIAS